MKSIIQEQEELEVLLSFLVTRLFRAERGKKRPSKSLKSRESCARHCPHQVISPIVSVKYIYSYRKIIPMRKEMMIIQGWALVSNCMDYPF